MFFLRKSAIVLSKIQKKLCFSLQELSQSHENTGWICLWALSWSYKLSGAVDIIAPYVRSRIFKENELLWLNLVSQKFILNYWCKALVESRKWNKEWMYSCNTPDIMSSWDTTLYATKCWKLIFHQQIPINKHDAEATIDRYIYKKHDAPTRQLYIMYKYNLSYYKI